MVFKSGTLSLTLWNFAKCSKMDSSWDLEPENETVFSYRLTSIHTKVLRSLSVLLFRFRKHNEATTKAQTKRCSLQRLFSRSTPARTTSWNQEWFTNCGTSITSTSLVNMIHPFSTFKQFWDRFIFYLVRPRDTLWSIEYGV